MLLSLFLGCALEVDSTEDRYLERRPGPEALVDADGNYVGGWWESWEGDINPEDASGREGALQSWIHFILETDRYFIIANLADLNRAANTALLVVDKEEQDFQNVSLQYTFGDNVLAVDPDWSGYSNPADGSSATISEDGMTFEIYADELSLVGEVAARPDEPFIQTTRSVDGYGWLQWYVNYTLVQGTLTIDGEAIELPPGALGSYDRMVGHRSNTQAWNWISAIGEAVSEDGLTTATVSLQIARDKDEANPRIDAKKYAVWIDETLTKLPEVVFDYEVLDEETNETSDWHIYTPDTDADWIDLSFTPDFHRRDKTSWLWFYNTDFNQHYGEVNGELHVGGETWILTDLFAVTEDSLLQF